MNLHQALTGDRVIFVTHAATSPSCSVKMYTSTRDGAGVHCPAWRTHSELSSAGRLQPGRDPSQLYARVTCVSPSSLVIVNFPRQCLRECQRVIGTQNIGTDPTATATREHVGTCKHKFTFGMLSSRFFRRAWPQGLDPRAPWSVVGDALTHKTLIRPRNLARLERQVTALRSPETLYYVISCTLRTFEFHTTLDTFSRSSLWHLLICTQYRAVPCFRAVLQQNWPEPVLPDTPQSQPLIQCRSQQTMETRANRSTVRGSQDRSGARQRRFLGCTCVRTFIHASGQHRACTHEDSTRIVNHALLGHMRLASLSPQACDGAVLESARNLHGCASAISPRIGYTPDTALAATQDKMSAGGAPPYLGPVPFAFPSPRWNVLHLSTTICTYKTRWARLEPSVPGAQHAVMDECFVPATVRICHCVTI